MSNEIQPITGNHQIATVQQTAFTNHQSNDGVQVANQPGGVVNFFMPGSNNALPNAANRPDTSHYNLFVVEGESFNENCFLIVKDRALTIDEGVEPDISAKYAPLSEEAKSEIYRFPSIFASNNRHYGYTDDDHVALYGFVTNIEVQKDGIKIYFWKSCYVPQQRLNEIAPRLAIQGNSSYNELCRTHWSIKRINLVEELRAIGLNIPIPI